MLLQPAYGYFYIFCNFWCFPSLDIIKSVFPLFKKRFFAYFAFRMGFSRPRQAEQARKYPKFFYFCTSKKFKRTPL